MNNYPDYTQYLQMLNMISQTLQEHIGKADLLYGIFHC
jgi:hypothetical protein